MPTSKKSKGKVNVTAASKNKMTIPLVKPKGVIIGAHAILMLVAPKPEKEDSDFPYDEYNPLSVCMPETMLSEEEMLNLVLKESMRMILEEQAIHGEIISSDDLPINFF